MTRVCAWCMTGMGEIDEGPPGVTHGICEMCLEKALKDVKRPTIVDR